MRNGISGLAGAAVLTAAWALGGTPVHAADIAGRRRELPYSVYTKWADAYRKETGTGLSSRSIGSGGGIKQIKAKTVTFGATEAPLSGKDLDEAGLAQFPMVMGGIVPVVNVGVSCSTGRHWPRSSSAK
jgi:phosphate transport system substrate-binding protein